MMSRRFGIYFLILPMFLSRLLLKPAFSEYTDWADFFVYLWPFLYGFIFMTDHEFIEIIKKKTTLLLNIGVLSSALFIYMAFQGEHMVEAYLHPSFSLLHLAFSGLSAIIAVSWIMFFIGFFAKHLNFNHKILIPANISILPIYVLHQTLIIMFGYHIVGLDLNLYIKFSIIVFTAIPASVILYKLIQTNNISRIPFGLKKKTNKKCSQVKQVRNAMAFNK
mgnify:CR=1 FL=1